IDPTGYLDMLILEKEAAIVMTDSGGLQEESCFFRVPCVTLRENTERPETLEIGSNVLAGTDPARVRAAVRRQLGAKREWPNPVDFDTLVPAYGAAQLAGSRLVYDIFDFYAEMITATLSPRLRGSLAKWERSMIARADAVIVPDLHRREQFGTTRPKHLVEILNVPEDRPVPRAREDP